MLVCDPPSGWRYGFPKPVPDNYFDMDEADFNDWLVEAGMPKEEVQYWVEKGRGVPCRFWEHNDG